MSSEADLKVCARCNGDGWYFYDEHHARPCEECCPHTQGWWDLTDAYSKYVAGEDNACCRHCGAMRRDLNRNTMSESHKHHALALRYAQDMSETSTPWERWEYLPLSGIRVWQPHPPENPSWNPNIEYRRKSVTLVINGTQVPEPMREVPAKETEYFVVDLTQPDGYSAQSWEGDDFDYQWLQMGLCHATEEAVKIHADALLSFSRTR